MLKLLLAWDIAVGLIVSLFAGINIPFYVGMLTGTATICINFRLLKVVINNLVTTGQSTFKIILSILLHMIRLFIFFGTIYVCVKISFSCAVGYSISVIGFALITVITYLRGDENDKCR